MFEGIPKELPQTSHKAQDFFISSLLISLTVSIKIIVLYEKNQKMKKIQVSHACRALRRLFANIALFCDQTSIFG
ncbi:hypothetical protein CQA81_10370 [Klebsiella pneumoniae]|nr:hypothetical protein CQA81_10370 [Klebsiella pneumoniae]